MDRGEADGHEEGTEYGKTDRKEENRVGTGLAKIISIVFHPFLMPLWGGLVLLYGPTYLVILPNSIKLYILGVLALTTFFFPAFTIGVMKNLKILSDYSLGHRRERILPLVTVILGYIICYYLFQSFISIGLLPQIVMGAMSIILICFVVNLFWKISLHMAAAGGIMAVFLFVTWMGYGQLGTILLCSILLSGCLGSARLYLEKHNIWQILAGTIAGIGGMLLVLYLFWV